MRDKSPSSAAAPLLETEDDRPSERCIRVRPVLLELGDAALKRAVIDYARSQQPSPRTRERILSSVLSQLGLANESQKDDG